MVAAREPFPYERIVEELRGENLTGRRAAGERLPSERRIARSVDDLVSRMPTPQEAESLRLPQGVPVTRVLRTVLDAQDDPVEVQETIGRPTGMSSATR